MKTTKAHNLFRQSITVIFALHLSTLFMPTLTVAEAADNSQQPIVGPRGPSELFAPMGNTAALLGGGAAHVQDLSAIDSNPAGLALNKSAQGYFFSGETWWRMGNLLGIEGGMLDSSTSEVAAGVKVRRTSAITGGKVYRATLGMAERIGESAFVVGLGGDYDHWESPKNDEQKKHLWRLRAGGLYQITPDIFVGAHSSGYFDASKPQKRHGLGVAWNTVGYVILSGDVLFDDLDANNYLLGVTVLPREWLDVIVSYGYEKKLREQQGALGIAVKSQKLRVSYLLQKRNLKDKNMEHFIGVVVNVLALGD